MPSPYDTYSSPLASRNASEQMLRLWSPRHKFNTWRRIWLAVAEAQHELGLPVSKDQVEELRAVVSRGITDDEIKNAENQERNLRHDVMAHVHALGDSCPMAKGIIHLGMTSEDVGSNADLLTIHVAAHTIRVKIARLVLVLGDSARQWVGVPTLGFTHYQAAQPVTVGRRIAGWMSDLEKTRQRLATLQPFQAMYSKHEPLMPLRGIRGATGTQAALVALSNSSNLIDHFEEAVLTRLAAQVIPGYYEGEVVPSGHRPDYPCGTREPHVGQPWLRDLDLDAAAPGETYVTSESLASQTYPRVYDTFILADLASAASVLHKIATDIRLLSNRKELDEPFEDKQIGSSAMPYKRNPMRCERICGLSRFVMNLVGNAYDTAATQWLERTLDDSSNRRLSLPEAFLALDGALDLMHNVASGLIVHEAMVKKNLMAELPFMATENILMACAKLGADRQDYHEKLRVHAQAAGLRVKQEGLDNDLLDRLKADKSFWSKARGGPLAAELDWDGVMDPMKYIGRSIEQTDRFINEVVNPLRDQYKDAIAKLGESGPKV